MVRYRKRHIVEVSVRERKLLQAKLSIGGHIDARRALLTFAVLFGVL